MRTHVLRSVYLQGIVGATALHQMAPTTGSRHYAPPGSMGVVCGGFHDEIWKPPHTAKSAFCPTTSETTVMKVGCLSIGASTWHDTGHTVATLLPSCASSEESVRFAAVLWAV
eukprot:COSAG02_NODE_23137_length_729_cov_0.823810_1_plen_113_part_00